MQPRNYWNVSVAGGSVFTMNAPNSEFMLLLEKGSRAEADGDNAKAACFAWAAWKVSEHQSIFQSVRSTFVRSLLRRTISSCHNVTSAALAELDTLNSKRLILPSVHTLTEVLCVADMVRRDDIVLSAIVDLPRAGYVIGHNYVIDAIVVEACVVVDKCDLLCALIADTNDIIKQVTRILNQIEMAAELVGFDGHHSSEASQMIFQYVARLVYSLSSCCRVSESNAIMLSISKLKIDDRVVNEIQSIVKSYWGRQT